MNSRMSSIRTAVHASWLCCLGETLQQGSTLGQNLEAAQGETLRGMGITLFYSDLATPRLRKRGQKP